MLRIDKTFGLLEFEQALAQLNRGDHQVLLAHSLAAEAVGGTAALLQLLASWGRRSNADLRVYAQNADDPALSRFAHTPVGLTALNMARAISTTGGAPIQRRAALLLAQPYVVQMHGGDMRELKHQNTIALLCLDNAKHLGRPARLYDPATEKVRPARDLADVLYGALEALAVMRARLRQAHPVVVAAATILFEAFQNTHEHARTDFLGNQLPRSTRGVLIGWRYVPEPKLAAAADGHALLSRYFTEWREPRREVKQAQFLELSVFDSGSGLAQTWLAKHGGLQDAITDVPITLAAELEAVHACLEQGGTTKSNRSAGNGLHRILRLASEHGGFVRLRTGRLSLGRAFSKAGELPADAGVQMQDLRTGEPPAQALAWAQGTVLTIMLPLNPEQLG